MTQPEVKAGNRLVGILLLAPAVIALAYGYVRPAVETVLLSFQRSHLFKNDSGWVGLDNYKGDDGGLASYGNVLLASVIPLMAITFVALGLAVAGSLAGTAGRWTVRMALALPMVVPAGALLAFAWADVSEQRYPLTVQVILATFGLVCGVGATVYLAALRRRVGEPFWSRWPAVVTVAGLLAIGVVAAGLQLFAAGGVPSLRDLTTPAQRIFGAAVLTFDMGRAAAIATPLLVVLAVLGIAATAIVVATRLRVTVEPRESTARNGIALAAAIVGSVVVLGISVLSLFPWLINAGNILPDTRATPLINSWVVTLVNSWFPPLLSTVVSIGLALLAAIGITLVRPFGERSEWLLMLFSPFLFVGTAPMLPALFDSKQQNQFIGLIPPVWIAVPALLIFCVFLRGQQGRPVGNVILSTLPLVVLVGGAMWMVQTQDFFWQLTASRRGDATALTLLYQEYQVYSARDPLDLSYGLALPLILVGVAVLVLIALQLFYLDRLAIRTGRVTEAPSGEVVTEEPAAFSVASRRALSNDRI